MPLIECVRRTILRHSLAGPETRIVAALSGGSDSVALACILQELNAAGDLRLVGLAHFNHQLRPSAAQEQGFCERVAETLGLPLLVGAGDVGALARQQRRSIEHAARTARHAFFEKARLHFGADVVALGHTRDDQAETYLLRLLRGAGVRGLASMHPRRDALIRPLLDCRRADLRSYLHSRRMSFVEDESNTDITIPRNRIRAELIPFLSERFNPSIVDVLADQAEVARDEWQWMTDEAATLAAATVRREEDGWHIDAAALASAPPALARLVLHHAMTEASGGRTITVGHAARVLDLLGAPFGGVDAPGQRVERAGRELVIHSRPAGTAGRWSPERQHPTRPEDHLVRYDLPIPGEVIVREMHCVLTAEEPISSVPDLRNSGPVAVIRRDGLETLSVRRRQPGDRFRPLGSGGGKKLQDFFVDRKVARVLRDDVPIVVDQADRIVWVAGHSIDDQFRVTDSAQAVLILRLKVLGGPE